MNKSKFNPGWTPFRIAALYSFLGVVWILMSDKMVQMMSLPPHIIHQIQTLKGWFYVVITGVLLYFLIRSMLRRQQRIEMDLADEAHYNRQLFDLSPMGLFLCRMDGTIFDVNASFGKMTGRSMEELLSLNTKEITPEKYFEQEHRQLNILMENREYGPYEKEFIHKDGHGVPVRVHYLLIQKGEESFVWCTVEDITAFRTTEEALRQTEDRYRMVLENIGEIYFEVDLAGNYTYVSQYGYRAFGRERSDILSTQSRSYMTPKIAETITLAFNRIYQTGEPMRQLQYETSFPDGTPRFMAVSASLMRDRNANPVGFHGISRDVTQQKQAETEKASLVNQLHQAQKMESIGRLAGGVAHDFNNILSVILGYSELLLEGIRKGHPHFDGLTAIHLSAGRARDLTRQLLAYSRKQILEMKAIDINTVVCGFEKLLRRMIGEDVELNMVLSESMLPVKADTTQLEQVLMNLAINAKDAMPDGGKLTIETGVVELDKAYTDRKPGVEPGLFAMIGVSDTGCGMESKVLENIFDPFFTTKSKDKGTGLGLATSYGIVKQHGGNIWVYSEPGEGTTFKIYLPLCDEKLEALPEPPQSQPKENGSATILVVEDEPSVREMSVKILKDRGYTVIESHHPLDAVAQAQAYEGTIHLLLTDVVMPQMKGPEVRAKIIETRPDMKVLYMSGYTDNVIVHHGILMDGIEFIQKPFSVNALLEKVQQVLKQR
ncbi:MAG: PAS domain S-box protein [Desulfobacteraceae bacterium]|nr:PAS domain S-box protein [Desulfobacteraceae bacterium]MBU4055253.1 PAS domain S-box protein [Pseudomonadota bacterium]